MTRVSTEKSREFKYIDQDFRRVQRLIRERVGIHLGDNKRDMVYSRLARRLRALGIPSMAAYLDQLDEPDHNEWQNFINALTTNLTSFFREKHHFDTLRDHLGRLGQRREAIRIWCCAASTGEEPYSIAMAALQALAPRPRLEIIASDVDTQALETAKRGVYSLERVRSLDPELLKAYFLKGTGANEGLTRVKPEVRSHIHYVPINLLDRHWPVNGPLDAIFCRNVFIYFQNTTQQMLLERFYQLMHPEGLFFAGHSESLLSSSHRFRALGRTVFTPIPESRGRSDGQPHV